MTVYTGQSYSPLSQGPISSINFSSDFRGLPYGADVFFGFTQGGSSYFLWQEVSVGNSSWFNASASSSSSSDFYEIYGYSHPDLATGPPIQFGLFIGYTVTGPGFTPRATGVDNFTVTVSPVPEPHAISIALLGLGLLALALRKQR